MRRALEEPLRQIAENAGKDGSVIVERVKNGEGSFGYNAEEDKFEDLFEAGIIDPAKVSLSALRHAASIASLIITTEAAITDLPKKDGADAPAGMGGMPAGMGGGMGMY